MNLSEGRGVGVGQLSRHYWHLVECQASNERHSRQRCDLITEDGIRLITGHKNEKDYDGFATSYKIISLWTA